MQNQNKIVPIWDITPDTPEQIRTQIERMTGLIEAQRLIHDGNPSMVLVNAAIEDEFLRLVQHLTDSKIIKTGE